MDECENLCIFAQKMAQQRLSLPSLSLDVFMRFKWSLGLIILELLVNILRL